MFIMIWLLGVLIILCASIIDARVQLPPPPGPQEISQTYIVTFASNSTQNIRDQHVDWLRQLETKNQNVGVRHVFSLAFAGYSAVLNMETLEEIRHLNEVASIDHVGISTLQRDNMMSILDDSPLTVNRQAEQRGGPDVKQGMMVQPSRGWNANRVSHRNFTKGYYAGPWVTNRNLGRGVTVYVLDTGINIKNPGFQGTQVIFGKNLVGSRNVLRRVSDNDIHGHGTMCAGVIAGNKHGLSPDSRVVAVKIANDQNRSATDDVVAGIEWVLSQPGDNNLKVISMSHYGFTGLPDVSSAVTRAVDRGLHFVVCAGNDGRDACRVQPSNARGVIAVGSVNAFNKLPVKGTSDAGGKEMESTNVGRCLTIFAPGSRVPTLSAKNLDPNYRYFSWGTSVAAPQVAALIANRLSEVGKQSPAQIKIWLQSTATKDQIEGDLKGSPNLILYNGLGG